LELGYGSIHFLSYGKRAVIPQAFHPQYVRFIPYLTKNKGSRSTIVPKGMRKVTSSDLERFRVPDSTKGTYGQLPGYLTRRSAERFDFLGVVHVY
jgi:hypothetical protein